MVYEGNHLHLVQDEKLATETAQPSINFERADVRVLVYKMIGQLISDSRVRAHADGLKYLQHNLSVLETVCVDNGGDRSVLKLAEYPQIQDEMISIIKIALRDIAAGEAGREGTISQVQNRLDSLIQFLDFLRNHYQLDLWATKGPIMYRALCHSLLRWDVATLAAIRGDRQRWQQMRVAGEPTVMAGLKTTIIQYSADNQWAPHLVAALRSAQADFEVEVGEETVDKKTRQRRDRITFGDNYRQQLHIIEPDRFIALLSNLTKKGLTSEVNWQDQELATILKQWTNEFCRRQAEGHKDLAAVASTMGRIQYCMRQCGAPAEFNPFVSSVQPEILNELYVKQLMNWPAHEGKKEYDALCLWAKTFFGWEPPATATIMVQERFNTYLHDEKERDFESNWQHYCLVCSLIGTEPQYDGAELALSLARARAKNIADQITTNQRDPSKTLSNLIASINYGMPSFVDKTAAVRLLCEFLSPPQRSELAARTCRAYLDKGNNFTLGQVQAEVGLLKIIADFDSNAEANQPLRLLLQVAEALERG